MDWLTVILIIMSVLLAFGIGAQDETMSTVYGSGALPLRFAMVIGSILSFLGVILLGSSVGKTIGANLLGENIDYSERMILAVLIGTVLWLFSAARLNVPISTTHTIVGAVFGISIVWAIVTGSPFSRSLNWGKMAQIIIGWILSPILGFFGAIIGQKAIKIYLRQHSSNLLQIEKQENYFRYSIIFFACLNQFSRGGNDSGNAVGILFSLLETGQLTEMTFPFILIFIGVAFATGLLLLGRNLVKMVGSSTGQLRPSEAIVIEATTALIMFAATIIGLPVSGGHILIFALIGSARMKGEKPDGRSFRRMVISWLITFPGAAIFSACTYALVYYAF